MKKKIFIKNYNKYLDKIYNYIWYRVNFNQAVAEDLCSEVFLKALKNIDSYDQDRSFQSWIYAIAKNHLANHYRGSGREVNLEWAINFSEDCIERINLSIESEEIVRLIDNLDDYSKEVIILRYVDELENKEIADLLGKEVNAIRVQISRSLDKLRKIIDENERDKNKIK